MAPRLNMNEQEIFESTVRSDGDIGACFEHDGETGYFYLYNDPQGPNHKITDAIRVLNKPADFQQKDVQLGWDAGERYVGLFIRNQLWAAFDTRTGAKYGGDYQPNAVSTVPAEVADALIQ